MLFLWLGLLKVFPGVSPAEPLMQASMPSPDVALFIRFSSVWEILVGLGFLSGQLPRMTLLLTFATMLATLSIPSLHWAARHSHQLLRGAYGIVFFWFGALKLVPGLDPSEPLVRSVVPVEPFNVFYAGLGLVEMFIAISLLIRPLSGMAVVVSLIFLASTIAVLFVHTDVMFSHFPVVLTLLGQHVLKNLVFLGAALVLVGARGGQRSDVGVCGSFEALS